MAGMKQNKERKQGKKRQNGEKKIRNGWNKAI